jgi:DNA-binding transcriptional LysR family regulator
MDLRHFRYFVAVAEELSFTRAAERLHIGQPPLSMLIKAMELEIDAKLFTRNRRKVELTPAGEVFLEKARGVLKQADDAISSAQRVARGEGGSLRIAFSSTPPLLPAFRNAIRDYKTSYPLVRLDLTYATASQQIDGLLANRVDVGFFRPSPFFAIPSDLETFTLLRNHLAVVVPAGHALGTRRGPVPVRALQHESFVFFPPDAGAGVYDHVIALCSRAGFMPQVVQGSRDVASILGLVATGLGISILPSTLKREIDGVLFRKLDDPAATSEVLLAFRRGELPVAVQRFLKVVRRRSKAS